MRRLAVPDSLGQPIAIASMIVCLFAGTASAGPVTLTSLVGDKDHGPYPNNNLYEEHSPAQIDPGDPVGFDWGYHGGGDPTPYLVDAVLNWTHSVDLTGIVVDSVQLDVAVIGFFYGTDHEKLYVGSPLTEIVNAFPAAAVTDHLQTFSFALPTSVLVSGSLPVQIFVQSDEGWGGVDYAELIVQGHTIDTTTVPEPATMTLAGLGIGLLGFVRRRVIAAVSRPRHALSSSRR